MHKAGRSVTRLMLQQIRQALIIKLLHTPQSCRSLLTRPRPSPRPSPRPVLCPPAFLPPAGKAGVAVGGGGDITLFVDPLSPSATAYVAYDAWANNHRVVIEQLTPDYRNSLGANASTGPVYTRPLAPLPAGSRFQRRASLRPGFVRLAAAVPPGSPANPVGAAKLTKPRAQKRSCLAVCVCWVRLPPNRLLRPDVIRTFHEC